MRNFEKEFLYNFRSFKLEAKGEEVLKELRSGNAEKLIELAKSLSSSFVSTITGIPDIPSYISTLIDSVKAGKGFLHYYSLEKYVEFFVRIHTIPIERREKFVKELEEDCELRERVIPVILMIVDKVSEMDKMLVITNIVNARTLYEIDNDTFFRMFHIVEQVSWPDLYLIYLKHCSLSDLDDRDRKVCLIDSNTDITKMITHNTGLAKINREVREQVKSSPYYGGKKGFTLKEDKKLTSLGKQFFTFAFKGFKYNTRQLTKYEET